MSLLHVLCGISGSGKSTLAKQLLTQYGSEKSVSINRDKIRELLFSYSEESVAEHYVRENFSKLEEEVTKYEDNLIRYSLQNGKTVVVDATHLRVKFLKRFEKFGVKVFYQLVEVDYDVALERDSKRVRKVGKAVIDKQWESLKRLKEDFDFKPFYPTTFKCPEYDSLKDDCIIFDIDGTLALKCDRSPFDWSKVADDTENTNVCKLFRLLRSQLNDRTKLIICSGRDGVCQEDTEIWLFHYSLTADKFYIRTPNDCRPDYIIKQEFWEEICKDYNVLFMVDDRNQVVDHARRLGFTVLQVAEGDF
jgi:predicted kinase